MPRLLAECRGIENEWGTMEQSVTCESLEVKTLADLATELLKHEPTKGTVILALIAKGMLEPGGVVLTSNELVKAIEELAKRTLAPAQVVRITREFEGLGLLSIRRINDVRPCAQFYARHIYLESKSLENDSGAIDSRLIEKESLEKMGGSRGEEKPLSGNPSGNSSAPIQQTLLSCVIGAVTIEDSPVYPSGKEARVLAGKLVKMWGDLSGRPRVKVLPRRVAMVRARLSEGYTPRDLARAVAGACYSPFHKGEGHDTFEVAIRNGSQVEKCWGFWSKHAPIAEIISYQKATGEIIHMRKAEVSRYLQETKADLQFNRRLAETKRKSDERTAKQRQEAELEDDVTSMALGAMEEGVAGEC